MAFYLGRITVSSLGRGAHWEQQECSYQPSSIQNFQYFLLFSDEILFLGKCASSLPAILFQLFF